MHTPQESQGFSDVVQQAQQIAHATDDSEVGSFRPITVTICDVDLSCIITNGEVYVQTTLQGFHDALSAAMVEFLSDLEAGISEARSSALAHARDFPQFHVKRVVESDVVRDCGER